MPFRNSLVAAVIATATTGRRIVIDALASLGSVIEFYSGEPDETEPARIRAYKSGTVNALHVTGTRTVSTSAGDPPRLVVGSQLGFKFATLGADLVNLVATTLGAQADSATIRGETDLALESGAGVYVNTPALEVAGQPQLGAWSTYTPQLLGASAALGNGTLEGRYVRLGRRVSVTITLYIGSTTNMGSAEAVFTLPYPAREARDVSGSAVAHIGSARYAGNAAGRGSGAQTNVYVIGVTNQLWRAGIPAAWTSGDRLTMSITYETDSDF